MSWANIAKGVREYVESAEDVVDRVRVDHPQLLRSDPLGGALGSQDGEQDVSGADQQRSSPIHASELRGLVRRRDRVPQVEPVVLGRTVLSVGVSGRHSR